MVIFLLQNYAAIVITRSERECANMFAGIRNRDEVKSRSVITRSEEPSAKHLARRDEA
ncbi:MAG: hypothetical protein IJ318_01105 [Clostridia bacterium]|nr:hypothetical protein [Clostridia bacterium]